MNVANSAQNVEVTLASAKATVMIYDDAQKKWMPSGTGGSGLSKVQLLQHQVANSYRVVGRKIADHEVVINCSLAKGLKYNQANQTFLQWRDAKQVYGLNFQTKDEADAFTSALKLAVEHLSKLAAAASDTMQSKRLLQTVVQQVSANEDPAEQFYNGAAVRVQVSANSNSSSSLNQLAVNGQQNYYQQRQSSDYTYNQQQQFQIDNSQKIYDVIPEPSQYMSQTMKTSNGSTSSSNGIGQSGPPPAPALPASMVPTSSGSAPPPPPPPPLPMFGLNNSANSSANDSHTSNGTAAAMAPPGPMNNIHTNSNNNNSADESKVVAAKKKEETKAPQIDFLTEIRMKIEKKNQQLQQQDSSDSKDSSDDYKNGGFARTKLNGSTNGGRMQTDSPKPCKKNSSTSNMSSNGYMNGNGHNNSYTNGNLSSSQNGNDSASSVNYDKLKNELLVEMRKEIQTMKNDIISALISEIRKANTN